MNAADPPSGLTADTAGTGVALALAVLIGGTLLNMFLVDRLRGNDYEVLAALVLCGVGQLVYVLPLGALLWWRGRLATLRGFLIAAGVALALDVLGAAAYLIAN